ncbi:hypothetical protein [Kocuria nitroreducens]|uniref:hypothetical protein n=1 Tax=Kocuria nitroreducens TaxID=3058914 RepID=UPI0036DA37C7
MEASERARRRGLALCATVAAAGVLTTALGWPTPRDLAAYGQLAWTNAASGALITALGLLLLAGSVRRRLRPTGDRVVFELFLVPPGLIGLTVLGGRLPQLVEPVLGLFLLWPAIFAVLLFMPQQAVLSPGGAPGTARSGG